MVPKETPDLTEEEYKRLKPTIDRTYPPGRFVAICGGKIIADAATFDELDNILDQRGVGPDEALAVQSGIDDPEFVDILVATF